MNVATWVGMIVVWAVVLGLAVWAVCRLFPANRGPDPHATLDARLASGDIDPSTYQQVLQQLDGRQPVATKGLR
ncbi:MAG: hypothetical protein L6367_16710 [Cellulomonas sp.]|nr:hypothetical protein [Cellulomonas sp.]